MADDKSKTGNPDRQRINTSEAYELRDWSQFGVTADELTAAGAKVGNQTDAVARHLKADPA